MRRRSLTRRPRAPVSATALRGRTALSVRQRPGPRTSRPPNPSSRHRPSHHPVPSTALPRRKLLGRRADRQTPTHQPRTHNATAAKHCTGVRLTVADVHRLSYDAALMARGEADFHGGEDAEAEDVAMPLRSELERARRERFRP